MKYITITCADGSGKTISTKNIRKAFIETIGLMLWIIIAIILFVAIIMGIIFAIANLFNIDSSHGALIMCGISLCVCTVTIFISNIEKRCIKK